ncbi:MAG: M56 family metallopeptidase/LCP family protein [Lachnospiraceae bacterium]|nr:M56 family metallopeptidase/LCP family protein [Lachnospiraceae bacterium]
MIEIFQLIFALSLQIGIVIGIVILLGYFVKKPYMAVGRYFLWLALAIRLLIPINLELVNIEELGQSIQNLQVSHKEEPVVDGMSDKAYKKKFSKETNRKEKSVRSQFKEKVLEEKTILEPEVSLDDISVGGKLESERSSNVVLSGIITGIKEWYQIHQNTIWNIMSIIWIIGIVGMIGYEVILYQSVYKSIQRWRRPASKEYQQQFKLVCQEMHISKSIPVYQCSKISSPMIVGIYRPSIILPEREYQKESLYYIYKHELTHYSCGDLYYKLLHTVVKCVYWFHPLVHAMYQQAAFDVELVCDEKVTKNQSETFCREYSLVLLDTLKVQNQRTFPFSTCFFYGGREQMKERFRRIMGPNKKKYGFGLFGLLIVCAVILGNISLHPKKDADVKKTEAAQGSISSSKGNKTKLSDKELTKSKNFLIVGQENFAGDDKGRADMNLLVTFIPQEKKCYVTEIARDLAITCENEYLKVSNAYTKYGMDTFKKVMEKEMGITIDSTIEVNFQQFEDVIDCIGGIQINLTKKEADYLNHTNYIREEKYRNVKKGKQLLNGQQVLGYARVRRVESSNGQQNIFGRGERALNIVSAMLQRIKEMDSKNWIAMASKMYDMVKTSQLDLETVYQIMQAVLIDGYTFETQQIPEADAYISKQSDAIGSYLFYDFSSSKIFQKLKGVKVVSENENGQEVVLSAGSIGNTQEEVNLNNVEDSTKDNFNETGKVDEKIEEEDPKLESGVNISNSN